MALSRLPLGTSQDGGSWPHVSSFAEMQPKASSGGSPPTPAVHFLPAVKLVVAPRSGQSCGGRGGASRMGTDSVTRPGVRKGACCPQWPSWLEVAVVASCWAGRQLGAPRAITLPQSGSSPGLLERHTHVVFEVKAQRCLLGEAPPGVVLKQRLPTQAWGHT